MNEPTDETTYWCLDCGDAKNVHDETGCRACRAGGPDCSKVVREGVYVDRAASEVEQLADEVRLLGDEISAMLGIRYDDPLAVAALVVGSDWLAGVRAKVLQEAADAIQALHPGEVKNSVVWLRARADALLPSEEKR